jgi:hypothetical protein|tara:strand:- start:396 stop:1169 length:774 start_codon:yes stop_codon:yes gene_type:complete
MKELKLSEIQKNWDRLRNLINNTFEGERLEKLNKMYDYFEDRMCVAPASGTEHFHNAHVGGYVEHVLHVVDLALKFTNVWEADGATIDFTVEEIIFAALHHDLGKIGDLEEDYYIPQESEWHRKNRGEIFTHNPKLNYMTVTDRAIFLLNHFGLEMSEKEYIGLRLTDGLYEEANKKYYITYTPGNTLKTNIAYILHQADMAASHIEYDEWKRGELQEEIKVEKKVENIKKAVTMEETSDQLSQKSKDLFDELFGDK